MTTTEGVARNITLDEPLTGTAGVYFAATAQLVSYRSAYQLIEIFQCPDLGRLMRIDGVNMTSERDEFFYHESLIHPAASAHPNPQRALIIGGGDGGAAEELLKHHLAFCQLCELDADVIRLSRQHLAAIHGDVFNDPRLKVNIGDGAVFVKQFADQVPQAAAFDLIYLDITDPGGEAAALYTPAFFSDCQSALADGGALIMHMGSPFSHPDRVHTTMANLRQQFAIVAPYFVHIPTYGATWGFAVASDLLDIREVAGAVLHQRLAERNVGQRQYYDAGTHHAMLALPPYVVPLVE